MPTQEPLAQTRSNVGGNTCPSAGLRFAAKAAMASFQAHSTSDCETCDQMLRDADYPFVKLHDRKTGQVVSAIQAGVALRRSGAGAVRPPRADLTEVEDEAMRGAIGEGPRSRNFCRFARISTSSHQGQRRSKNVEWMLIAMRPFAMNVCRPTS